MEEQKAFQTTLENIENWEKEYIDQHPNIPRFSTKERYTKLAILDEWSSITTNKSKTIKKSSWICSKHWELA